MKLYDNEINLENLVQKESEFKTIINTAFIEKELEINEETEIVETKPKHI